MCALDNNFHRLRLVYEITVVCAWSGIYHRLAWSAQSHDRWHSVAAFVSCRGTRWCISKRSVWFYDCRLGSTVFGELCVNYMA